MSALADSIRAGDIRALARAASAIENQRPEAESLLQSLYSHTGRAMVIGITGAPGAGKSTLTDQLISALRKENKTVGVLAVDPTSPYSGGAILGDRVRMQSHHADPGVFIRSMATRGWLGGLARATTDLTLLLDASGRDVILVETVGVGQGEVEIARLADVTLVLLVPNSGDDVQTLKAGVMEIADVFVINKSDLAGADQLEREVKASLTLAHRADGWIPPVVRTIATMGEGIAQLLEAARGYHQTGLARARAAEIWALRLREMLRERLMADLNSQSFDQLARDVAERRMDPYSALNHLMQQIQSKP